MACRSGSARRQRLAGWARPNGPTTDARTSDARRSRAGRLVELQPRHRASVTAASRMDHRASDAGQGAGALPPHAESSELLGGPPFGDLVHCQRAFDRCAHRLQLRAAPSGPRLGRAGCPIPTPVPVPSPRPCRPSSTRPNIRSAASRRDSGLFVALFIERFRERDNANRRRHLRTGRSLRFDLASSVSHTAHGISTSAAPAGIAQLDMREGTPSRERQRAVAGRAWPDRHVTLMIPKPSPYGSQRGSIRKA